jgi:ABC-type transporter MlaC component
MGLTTTNPSHRDFTAAFTQILASPWGSKLTQYRGASVGMLSVTEDEASAALVGRS